MGGREELKARVCAAVEAHRERIFRIGDAILREPELGFKEFKTAKLVSQAMDEFQVPKKTGLAITGVKGVLKGKRPGPTIALLGELDALKVVDHPMADPQTGAAHACGHNAQIASLLGAMMALVESRASEAISGNVVFFAVPAEEYGDIDYRLHLIERGELGFLGGKPELLRLGHFDDIDMAMIIHGHVFSDRPKVIVGHSSNGIVVKKVRFLGKAAHAGTSPHFGINALNAAHIALAAIHAQRETFQDRDTIRVHPIITKGGDEVNVVPSEVCLESYVRGKSKEAIAEAEKKVDRALRAGAMAVGADVEINTIPGYMPLTNNLDMARVFKANVEALLGETEYMEGGHGAGSTDLGDLSQVKPVLHPLVGGAVGPGHSSDYKIVDKELNLIVSAKLLALTAVDLLYGDAREAATILKAFKPEMTKRQYLKHQERVFRTELYRGEAATSEWLPHGSPSSKKARPME